MTDLLIRNGRVVTAIDDFMADILVRQGRIVAIGTELDATLTEEVDATGKLVFPGVIDPHTHVGWPGAADDFVTGTKAAACGGVTCIVEYALQFKGNSLHDSLGAWHTKADDRSCVDYAFHLVISDFNSRTRAEIGEIIAEGVPSFKLFMTSRHSGGLGVNDGTIYGVMHEVAQHHGVVNLHCENDDLIEFLISNFRDLGLLTPEYHARSRPPIVEAEAIQRAAFLAGVTGCTMYVPHLSSGLGLDVIRSARARNVTVHAETCPQFLVHTDEVYRRADAVNYVMSPPIKGETDQDTLWSGLAAEEIGTVGSDHCPYDSTRKREFSHDFTKIPNGVPGVETILPILYSEGVRQGRLTLQQLVKVTSYNAARTFGLLPRKGSIAVGADADLVIFDPQRTVSLRGEHLHSNIDYSIYDDLTVTGYPAMTILRGEVIYQDGKFVGVPGYGRYVPRRVAETVPDVPEALTGAR